MLSLWFLWFALSRFSELALGADANVFEFEGEIVESGSQTQFLVEISDALNYNTSIPCVVFHGSEPGPVLGITAGVHGYEYAPILAGQRILMELDASTLHGTVIMVLISNPPSFLGRSPYINPLDQQNLNRAFPGNPNGTLTFRIADWISQHVIPRCDYFLDAHSGDAPEDLMPYVAYYHAEIMMDSNDTTSLINYSEVSAKARNMASHMGFEHVIVFNTTGQDYIQPSHPALYCSAQAFKLGIPAVDIECGRLGRVEPAFVERIVEAFHRLLGHLNMTDSEGPSKAEPTYITNRSFLDSSHAGIWYPARKAGDTIGKGEIAGRITDFFGKLLEEVQADATGLVLYILGTPPVNEGESLVSIGILEEEDAEG